jgi:hypothetical protein
VNRFPRIHKPLLGHELLGLALRLLITLLTANRRRDKVLSLKTVPIQQHTQVRCVSEHGFSLHAKVRRAANQRHKFLARSYCSARAVERS